MSRSFSPSIQRTASSTMGTPVTLLMYGTVRLERGFTSMMNTSLLYTTNWIFIRPTTFSARARRPV